MAQERIEFELTSIDDNAAAVPVKVGEKVSFNAHDRDLRCQTSTELVCGTVPQQFCHHIGADTTGIVRSLRRGSSGATTSIVVRLVHNAAARSTAQQATGMLITSPPA
jgi:hypothetical protein